MKFEVGKKYRITTDENIFWGLCKGDEFVVSRVDADGDAFCSTDYRMPCSMEWPFPNEVCIAISEELVGGQVVPVVDER